MSNETLLLIILIILILGVLPAWPYSNGWGYGPSGGLVLILVVLLIWAVAGGRPIFHNSPGSDLKSTVQDTGHDLRDMGRDAATNIRDTVNGH